MTMTDRPPETYAYTRAPKREESDVPLASAYLNALIKVESRPQNQSGEDKTWVERAISEWDRHYRQAVRVR
jgi:hypothetical protein